MVRVDVFDLEWRQLLRQLGTHQRVAQRRMRSVGEAPRSHSKAARSAKGFADRRRAAGPPHQVLVRERLEIPAVSFQNERSARLRSLGETRLPLQQITCVPQRRNSAISSIT